jgi:hypothetical protein
MFTIHQKNQAIYPSPSAGLIRWFDKELPMTDGYSQLLGIGVPGCPLTLYQLLGIDPSEKDSATIRAAADICLGKLEPHASGALADDCAKIAAEIIGARDTLLDPAARQRYDERTAPAPEPWWKPDVSNAAPEANAAPVAGWWKDLQPAEPAPPAAAPVIQTAPRANPPINNPPASVVGPAVNSAPLTAPAATVWWSDAIEKPAPAAAAPAAVDWWKDAATKEAVSNPSLAAAAPAPTAAHVPIITPIAMTPPLIEPSPLPAASPLFEPSPLAAAPLVESLPLSAVPAAASLAMPEMSLDDAEIRPPDRRSSGSSMLPWVVLGLTILGCSIGAGVWYVNQQNPEPVGRDVAVNGGKNDRTPPIEAATKSKHPEPKTNRPANKSEQAPPNVRPPIVVDPGPEKIEPKPPVMAADFTKPRDFHSSTGTVLGIALSRDASTFITTSSDKSVMVGATGTGDQTALHRLKSEGVAPALCLDDKVAVFCDGFEIVVYDLQKREVLKVFQNPRGGIQCLAASAKGGLILTGSTDGCVRCWDLNIGKLQREIDVGETAVTAVAASGDGQIAEIGLADGGICICNPGTGKLVKRWKGHAGRVTTLAFSPSGAMLASGGEDSFGRVWDCASGKSIAKLAGHDGPILGSGWCADGRRIVTAGVDKKVCLWNAESGELSNWVCGTREKTFCIAIDSHDRFVLAGQSEGIVQLFPLPEK